MKVNGLENINNIVDKCDQLLNFLEKQGKTPNDNKVMEKLFSIKESSELVKKDRDAIYRAEKKGVFLTNRDPITKRTKGLTLDQINVLREHFGTTPKSNKCIKIAIQSFKGGVAKSVTSVHMAQYFAKQGYRVLLVDFDPQASATSSFGFLPDNAFSEKDTMLPYLQGLKKDINYCIIDTYFPKLKLIPCCLPFYDAEFQLAFAAAEARNSEEKLGYFTEFRDAFDTIDNNYDLIIFDSPPALGMITINILTSADALIIPTPPALYDFSSTVQYFKMIQKVLKNIDPNKQYQFIKILITRADTRKTIHKEFIKLMKEIFSENIFSSIFFQTSEIESYSARFKTIYDLNKPQKRALEILESMFEEIKLEVLQYRAVIDKKHKDLNNE